MKGLTLELHCIACKNEMLPLKSNLPKSDVLYAGCVNTDGT